MKRIRQWAAGLLFGGLLATTAGELPGDEHFKVETLAGGFIDAMEIAVADDGRVFIVERTGGVHVYEPDSAASRKVDQIAVEVRRDEGYAREAGLLGITLDPKFSEKQWL